MVLVRLDMPPANVAPPRQTGRHIPAVLISGWRHARVRARARTIRGKEARGGGGWSKLRLYSDQMHPYQTTSHNLPNPPHSQADNMDLPTIQRLAPPGVTALVVFLAHSSQWLFYSIEPGPLRKGDAYLFNALVASLLICYWRTCFTDPGRIPRDWWESSLKPDGQDGEGHEQKSQRQRWCRKCETYKAPRAHHCKTCKRYGTNH